MLHSFLVNNRTELIARCVAKVASRPLRNPSERQLQTGIPMFIDQLTHTLKAEQEGETAAGRRISGAAGGDASNLSELGVTAAAHGTELFRLGYTVDQVVHCYGDLCQAITDLAVERNALFSIAEFRTLNRCLDNAIADAVTSFSYLREAAIAQQSMTNSNAQLGFLMHEIKNALNAAVLAVNALESGRLGSKGATSGVLKRSLVAAVKLIDSALHEVRLKGAMSMQSVFPLAPFISEAKDAAELDAQARGCTLLVANVDPLLALKGNRDVLLGALANLLNNAVKFTHTHSEVQLRAYGQGNRIIIDVQDHCGGLPPGSIETMFIPFTQHSGDKTGLGLGLSIARQNIAAEGGTLSVKNLPGTGCVFTINLPRYTVRESQTTLGSMVK